jgi:hypothetical protein
MRILPWVLPAFYAVGCAAAPPRADWQVALGEGVVASNSPAIAERLEPERAGDSVRLDYPILFENVGTDLASIGLGHAVALVEGVSVEVGCRVGASPVRVLLLEPGESRRVSCEVRVDPKAAGRIGRRDALLVLHLPVRRAFGQTEIRFHYRLWLRDFS